MLSHVRISLNLIEINNIDTLRINFKSDRVEIV
jgi:hypothetical protein